MEDMIGGTIHLPVNSLPAASQPVLEDNHCLTACLDLGFLKMLLQDFVDMMFKKLVMTITVLP